MPCTDHERAARRALPSPRRFAPTSSVRCEHGTSATARSCSRWKTARRPRGAKAWERLKNRPYAGIAVASAVGFAVASLTGVGELAVAVLCGYGAYEILRRGRPVCETVEEMVKDVEKMA